MWFSSGGTKSVIHNDDQDNINCVLSGKKRLVMMHPRSKLVIEEKAYGWVVAKEDIPAAYGAYSGLNVEAMDLQKYPAWRGVEWYDVQIEQGDCLYIPSAWYHHVQSDDERNLAINLWWWRNDQLNSTGTTSFECDLVNINMTLADCKFGYDLGSEKERGAAAFTQCKPGRSKGEKLDVYLDRAERERFCRAYRNQMR